MKKNSFVTALFGSALPLLLATAFPTALPQAQAQTGVKVIFDTDMDLDVDDAGALAVLHALADNGEAEILGIVCDAPAQRNGNMRLGVASISAINNYYMRPGIPIGDLPVAEYINNPPNYSRYRGYANGFADPFATSGTPFTYYNEYIKANFPDANVASVFNGTALYRKLLAAAPDDSVVIIGVGLLRVLNDLMYTGADEYSSLTGKQLIDKKVKRLVCMAGLRVFSSTYRYDDDFNWAYEGLGDAERITREWPSPIVVMPWGSDNQTGARLSTETPSSNPVRRAYEVFLDRKGSNRSSWDQLAVIAGVRGAGDIFNEQTGRNIEVIWDADHRDSEGNLAQLYYRWDTAVSTDRADILLGRDYTTGDAELTKIVEDLMVQAPTRKYAGQLEAESAFLSGVTYSKVNDGYTGNGYGNYNNINTDYVEWTLKNFNNGPVNLKFRYANGYSDNRPLKLTINGTVVASNLAFNPTGSWTAWATTSGINVNLINGQNKIRLTATDEMGVNLDHLRYEVLQSGTYQAEYAYLSGATVSTHYEGYVAGGYATYNDNAGYIEWTIDKEIASSINLKFRYANGFSTNRPLKLSVNGTVITSTLAFDPTGSWTTWVSTDGITVNLKEGQNKVRLTEADIEGPNMDSLSFTSNPSSSTTSSTTSLESDSTTETSANES